MTRQTLFGRLTAATLVLGLLVVGTASSLAGASRTEGSGKSNLVVGLGERVESLDPDSTFSVSAIQVLSSVLEPLISVAPDGKELAPGIADSWEYSKDGLTLTVKLNPDAAFSTGAPVTAEDVVFTMNEAKAAPNFGLFFASVDSFDSPAQGTVAMHLSAPDYTLPYLLATIYAAPIPADYGGKSREDFYQNPIGAGPFSFDSVDTSEAITLAANKSYYRSGQPKLSTLTYRFITDDNQRKLQFESGDLDMIERVPTEFVNQIPDSELTTLKKSSFSVNMALNNLAGPTSDESFRKGLSLAINRKDLAKGVFSGYASPAKKILVPNVANAPDPTDGSWATFNAKEAKKLIKESGYDGSEVSLLVSSSPAILTIAAQAIQQQLQDAGVDVKVETTDEATKFDRTSAGDFDMTLQINFALAPNEVESFGAWLGTKGYLSGADLTSANEQFAAFISSPDDQGRDAAIVEFENEGLKTAPVLAVTDLTLIFAKHEDVKGLKLTPLGVYRTGPLSKS